MREYYKITDQIRKYLIAHAGVNTVVVGNITDVDLQKQTLYPLAQIIVDQGSFDTGTIKFNVQVLVMDSAFVSNEDPLLLNDTFEGLDNKQDIYNSTLAVVNGLQMNLRQGKLYQTYHQIEGTPTVNAFEDDFGNLLTGWRLNFTVVLPNTEVSTCNEFAGGYIPDTRIYTFDTTLITF